MVNTANKASFEEEYSRYIGVCKIPQNITHQRILNEVPRVVCRRVCSGAYNKHCSGFLYDRRVRSCILSPFTGEPMGRGGCRYGSDDDGLEFYRRRRKLGRWLYTTVHFTVFRVIVNCAIRLFLINQRVK